MKTIIHLSIFLFFSTIAFAQDYGFDKRKISKPILKLVRTMSKHDVISAHHYIGLCGLPAPQYTAYEEISKQATDEELIELTSHKSPVVRCYAFRALVEREQVDVRPILLRHAHDRVVVAEQSGCIGSGGTVRDFFISAALKFNKLRAEELEQIPALNPYEPFWISF